MGSGDQQDASFFQELCELAVTLGRLGVSASTLGIYLVLRMYGWKNDFGVGLPFYFVLRLAKTRMMIGKTYGIIFKKYDGTATSSLRFGSWARRTQRTA
jgi:hypothetical protein